MKKNTTIQTSLVKRQDHGQRDRSAGLLVAFSPTDATTVDRCEIARPFVVGRSSDCSFSIRDEKISKRHFRIDIKDGDLTIEDLGSTNGTFLNGARLEKVSALPDQATIRAGQCLFTSLCDSRLVLRPPPAERYGMIGRFHSGPIIESLYEASLSSRHILVTGPSGTGKELAARALATMLTNSAKSCCFVAHNAARFSSEDEAMTTLFGVGSRVFSNVAARAGLLEEADGGVLFLDEVHNLPQRVQRGLLRTIEENQTARIGEIRTRPINLRFVLASNALPPDFGLSPDLLARLRTVRIPSIAERIADVPAIFQYLLNKSLSEKRISARPIIDLIRVDHYEALMLNRFESDNIRGLIDIADRIATRIAAGTQAENAIATVCAERLARNPTANPAANQQTNSSESSPYQKNKELIIRIYKECDANLSATERQLQSQGVRCSRRWLRSYLIDWGVKRNR